MYDKVGRGVRRMRSWMRMHWTEACIQNADGVVLAHATGLFIAIRT